MYQYVTRAGCMNPQIRKKLWYHTISRKGHEKNRINTLELEGVEYLVTVDYFSNYWELDKLNKNTSSVVINKPKVHFSPYGIPCTITSDNAMQSTEFRDFTQAWDIEHNTPSPHHPRVNGIAESAVKTAKLRKCKVAIQDPSPGNPQIQKQPVYRDGCKSNITIHRPDDKNSNTNPSEMHRLPNAVSG